MSASSASTPRRLSPPLYKALLTAHIVTSVGWLGVVIAKIALGVAAVSDARSDVGSLLFAYAQIMNPLFPPAAIATVVTGVLLSLCTRWGLLDYYWVIAKLVLTVAVIVTAVRMGDRLLEQALNQPAGSLGDDGAMLTVVWMSVTALSLSIAHATMLAIATVLSVFKPWGRTWFTQRSGRVAPSGAFQRG